MTSLRRAKTPRWPFFAQMEQLQLVTKLEFKSGTKALKRTAEQWQEASYQTFSGAGVEVIAFVLRGSDSLQNGSLE